MHLINGTFHCPSVRNVGDAYGLYGLQGGIRFVNGLKMHGIIVDVTAG